jgi:hypothetical protein
VGRRRYFIRSNDFYLPSLRLEEGGRVINLWSFYEQISPMQ